MRAMDALRYGMIGLAFAGAGTLALAGMTSRAEGQASFIENGRAGFVISHIEYGLSNDAAETGACPNGMTTGYMTSAQADADRAAFARAMTTADGQNLCQNPEAGQPDPNFRTVSGANVPVYGIDLDGQNSTRNSRAAPGACAQDDFRGMHGERGIDNQLFRVVGCSNSYQSTGQSNTFETSMLVGEWGILLTLSGVDDIRNDNSVEVGFYGNADPIQLSPNREPLQNATYAMDQDPEYRATAHGRIVNGVLTTDPIDVQFRYVVNSMRLKRPLHAARLQVSVGADGALDGYLAGYMPVEAAYDLQYGYRSGLDGTGAPSRARAGSAAGTARTQGHTCQGAYFALLANADGDRDPATGRCTSISTQYRIRAIPAFVVDQATTSTNSDLVTRER